MNVAKATKPLLLDTLKQLPVEIAQNTEISTKVSAMLKTFKAEPKKVSVKSVRELFTEVQSFFMTLVFTDEEPPIEAKLKAKTGKADEKPETEQPKAETEDDAKKEPPKAEEKKPVASEKPEDKPKPTKKKAESKKSAVETTPPATNASKDLPTAKMFPDEFMFESEDGPITLKSVHKDYHDFKAIRAALEEEKQLYIAAYWTKLHVRKFNYKEQFALPEQPKGFPLNLDVLSIVLVLDKIDRLYAVSTYTDAVYRFDAPSFVPIEDEDVNGNKFTVRVDNGMEFELYAPKDEVK